MRSAPSGYIGLFSPDSGTVELIQVAGRGIRPYGLTADWNHRPWIAFIASNAIWFGTDTHTIGRAEVP